MTGWVNFIMCSKRKTTRQRLCKLTAAEVDSELAASSANNWAVDVSRRPDRFLSWDSQKGPARRKAISILTAPDFSARGMRRIYGRGDHFPRLSCGMVIFLRRDARVFVRFYSPGLRETYRTYELLGLKLRTLPQRGAPLGDDCVPEVLRDLYEGWVEECLWHPDDID
jgi:hypothetical protein